MEFKKNINGKNVRFFVSEWTGKVLVEVDGETSFVSWELAFWGLISAVGLVIFGYIFGKIF